MMLLVPLLLLTVCRNSHQESLAREQKQIESETTEAGNAFRGEFLQRIFNSLFSSCQADLEDPRLVQFKKENLTVSGISNIAVAGDPVFNAGRRGGRETIVVKFKLGPVTLGKGKDFENPITFTPTGQAHFRIVKKGEDSVTTVNNLKINSLTRKDLGLTEMTRSAAQPIVNFAKQLLGKRRFLKELTDTFETRANQEFFKRKLDGIPRN